MDIIPTEFRSYVFCFYFTELFHKKISLHSSEQTLLGYRTIHMPYILERDVRIKHHGMDIIELFHQSPFTEDLHNSDSSYGIIKY